MDRISVKFKTAEKVGPVGEGRSAEAQAVVTLVHGLSPFKSQTKGLKTFPDPPISDAEAEVCHPH